MQAKIGAISGKVLRLSQLASIRSMKPPARSRPVSAAMNS
jgi:hypothetical protein